MRSEYTDPEPVSRKTGQSLLVFKAVRYVLDAAMRIEWRV